MLTKTNTEKAHNQILIDTDTLCTQIESENPFSTNRDLVFSQKNKSINNSDSCSLPENSKDLLIETSNFFEDSLLRSLKRLKKHPKNKSILNSVAQNYMRKGEINKAIERLKELLSIDNFFLPAISNLAECYSQKNEIQKAIKLYTDLGEERQEDIQVLTNKALLYLRNKEFKIALELLLKAKKIHADNSIILNNLGIVYLALGQSNNAIQSFRKATKKIQNDYIVFNNLGVAYIAINNHKKALNNFKIAHTLNKSDRNVTKNLVTSYHRFEEYESIVEILDAHLHSFPEDNELRTFTCDSYYKMGLYKKCLQELHRSLKYENESNLEKRASLHNNIAVVYEKLNNDVEARNHYIECFNLNSKPSIIIFYNLFGFMLKINEPEICKGFIDIAIKQYGRTPILLIYLGKYYSRLENYIKAKAIFHEAIDRDEKLIDGYIDLSVIESEVYDNNDEALKILEKALLFYPDNTLLLNNYTYCKILTGDLIEARKVLDRIGETKDVTLNATRGLLFLKENDLENGRRYYNKAISLAMKDKNLYALVNQKKHLELGKYYIQKGDIRNALSSLKKGKRYNAKEQYYKNSIVQLIENLPC